MKNAHWFVRVAVAASLVSVLGSAHAAAPPPGIPQPKILVIDRQAILLRSSAGQAILQQARNYSQQAENELKGQASALRAQGQQLQQQLAILSADVKAKKMRDFEAQRASLEQKAQQKQGLIQGGVFQARQQLGDALGPILKGIMTERGANMLLDRNAVIFSTVDIDVTQIAIQRLNQKLSNVKVNLVPLPAGVQPQ